MKRFFAILLVAVLLLSMIPATSMAAKYGTVVGGWLRLRSAPNFNASTITSYYTGTVVEITGTDGGWYRVYTPDGRSGYMYGQYLKVSSSSSSSSSSANAYVTSHNGYGVRLRQGPGTGYRVITTYDVGTPVTVLERGNYWCKVSIYGTTGYMMTQYLSINGGYYDDDDDNVVCYATIWSRNGYGVRLRKGPGKDYGTIGTYSVGTTVAVLKKGDTWDKIRVGSRVGYMMNEFLDYHKTNEVTSVTLNNYNPAVGSVLSVKAISPSKATVSYEWRVNGVTKGTASTYTVTSADVGYQIQLKVKGTGSYTGSAKSAKTEKVLSNTQISDVTLNTTAPVVGNTLKATVKPSSATVIYAWIVGDSQVSNAATYQVKAADAGKVIKLIVTGTGNYSGSKTLTTSAVTATGTLTGVSIENTSNTASGAVPAVGNVLRAVTSPAQTTATYQWMSDGAAISGATSKTYTLTSNEVGKAISVKVTATAPYIGGPVTSNATAKVIAQPTAPAITTTSLPGGTVGASYSQTLQVTGTTPITWSVANGSLPGGVSLDAATGVLSGTPTAAGTFTFTVRAANPAMQTASRELSVTIADNAPAAAPALTIGQINIIVEEGYTPAAAAVSIANTGTAAATLSAVTAADPSFTVTAGNTTIEKDQTDISWKITPPAGKLAGSTTTTTLTASYNGLTANTTVTLTVNAKTPVSGGEGGSEEGNGGESTAVVPNITTYASSSVKAGQAYELALTATGTGNLTWTAANLPQGLALNGAAITGTIQEAGDYEFTVTVTSDDAALGSNNTDQLKINLTVTAVSSGETETPTVYTVTVEGGTADKSSCAAGETVTINASGESGKAFKEWTVVSGGMSLANAASATTTFTMPEGNAEVKAVYEAVSYTVTVEGGTADRNSCAAGETVTINASGESGKTFKEWTVVSGGMSLANEASATTTFTMPAGNVEVKAVYQDIPKYSVSVSGGSGSGSYAEGATVTVTLGEVPDNKKFTSWKITGLSGMESSTETSISFTMPAGEVTVAAQYENVVTKLSKPTNLSWEVNAETGEGTASWSAVSGAVEYEYYRTYHNGTETTQSGKYKTSGTSVGFSAEVLEGHQFWVRAIGDGETTSSSDYAESAAYTKD